MNDDKKVNGWANRSTWLAKLHLDNDSLTVTEMAQAAGIESDTLKQFKNAILRVLLEHTTVVKENEFDISDIDFNELWDAYRIAQ